ncbi:MAG: DUF4124 domain-containing protein [Pseudomonadota bacterium]
MWPTLATLGVLLLVPHAAAQEVFRSVDENGVVTFSDVESDDAERLELPEPVVRENAEAEQAARIEQTLAVAKSLEESRLAREEARTERLKAKAESQPRTVYYREDDRARYTGRWGWGYWPGHRPWPPGGKPYPPGPVHPIEPPPGGGYPPPSRPVPLPPLNGSGG